MQYSIFDKDISTIRFYRALNFINKLTFATSVPERPTYNLIFIMFFDAIKSVLTQTYWD